MLNDLEFRMAQVGIRNTAKDVGWEEGKHPRASNGQFSSGGSASQGGSASSPATVASKSPTQSRLEKELIGVYKQIEKYAPNYENYRGELSRLAEREETLSRQLSKHTDVEKFYKEYEANKAGASKDGGPGSGRKPEGKTTVDPRQKKPTLKDLRNSSDPHRRGNYLREELTRHLRNANDPKSSEEKRKRASEEAKKMEARVAKHNSIYGGVDDEKPTLDSLAKRISTYDGGPGSGRKPEGGSAIDPPDEKHQRFYKTASQASVEANRAPAHQKAIAHQRAHYAHMRAAEIAKGSGHEKELAHHKAQMAAHAIAYRSTGGSRELPKETINMVATRNEKGKPTLDSLAKRLDGK